MSTRPLLVFLMVMSLTACVPPTYRYGGVAYSSPAEALAAQQAALDKVVGNTEPLPTPVAQRARVVVPSKQAVLERAPLRARTQAGREFAATGYHNALMLVPRMIKKRNIFEQVEVVETATPEPLEPVPGVVTIYRYMSYDAKAGSWYYSSQAHPRAPLNFDTGQSERSKRYGYFLNRVEELAAAEKMN